MSTGNHIIDLSADQSKTSEEKSGILYRCDELQGYGNPQRLLCLGNVIFQRDDLMMCCNQFDILYKNDEPHRLKCQGKVKLQKGQDMMWSEAADYFLSSEDLVLSNKPLLKRGPHFLEGLSIVVDPKIKQAQVIKPRGALGISSQSTGQSANQSNVQSLSPIPLKPIKDPKNLPATCPLPTRPK